MPTVTRLAQVALHADDLDRAARFYSVLLGSEPTGRFDPPGLLFFDVGGTRLLLERGAPASLLYLQVDDIEAALAALDPDTTVVSQPHAIFRHDDDRLGPVGTDEWHAFLEDSEGNTVGLVCFRPTVG